MVSTTAVRTGESIHCGCRLKLARHRGVSRGSTARPWIAAQSASARFPYALLYIIDEEAIVVIGCFHTARDPSAWQDRSDRYLREAE